MPPVNPADTQSPAYAQAAALTPTPLNSWIDFRQNFGDIQAANACLAQAVYGFFNNGGTRCWVTRIESASNLNADLPTVLEKLESIDEIAILAAPLPPTTDPVALNEAQVALIAHCVKLQNRVAVLDSARDIAGKSPSSITSADLQVTSSASGIWTPADSGGGYEAFYFPWIWVADPNGPAGARVAVPPSGHVAGIYARSDAERGVWKAPANEVILGALDVYYPVSKFLQGALNPDGVNCIRSFNGTITVYGARTLDTTDLQWNYINVRRTVNYLRASIEAGTQWVVFEPNAPDLWSKIRRNVGAFLNSEWAAGALVGAAPAQAFYVRCDETTNPPDVQASGQVITEIGVAIVRPAEFVIFRLAQWAGPGQ